MYIRTENTNPQFFSDKEINPDVIERRSFHSFTKSGYPLYAITLLKDPHLTKENGIKISISSKPTYDAHWENTGLPLELFSELKDMIKNL